MPEKPLCIDLDGTLIQGNSLWKILKSVPLTPDLFYPLSWPLIKKKITSRSPLKVNSFSFYKPLVKALFYWKSKGVPLFLVTGAHEKMAHQIAQHLGCFQDVWASTSKVHLVGPRKAHHLVTQFGPFGFSYIADSWRDLPVWKASHDIIAVASSSSLLLSYLKVWKKPSQKLFIL